MLYVLLLSILCAVLVYSAAYGLGSLALQRIYMSPDAVASRQAEIYSDFSLYASSLQLSGTDTAAVSRFSDSHPYAAVTVYSPQDLGLSGAENSLPMMQARYAAPYGRLYPIRLADGIYYIGISDTSQLREDGLNRIIALLLAGLSLIAIMFWYIRRLTDRIVRLSREADVIGSGDLEAPITVKGEDEVAILATEMDHMRRSVIERMSGERRAWEANSELITAISHDIRTPMTALMGYLELLNEGGAQDPERTKQFAASAYGKATELKELTDELFRYFLVFGRAELELNREELDGRLLLEQLLGEAEFDLRDAGFTVERIEFQGECRVVTDPMYLKRVLDNLVSNARKYASREQPILILTEWKDGMLSVVVSNAIAGRPDRVESTKIGLRTCEKIMQAMGGSFVTHRDEEHFAAEFSLPAKPI